MAVMQTETQLSYYGTGRRKTATARVFLKKGKGQITINQRTLETYFGRKTARMLVCQPLESTGLANQLDVNVSISGGGINGQAGAIRHGIARALLEYAKRMETQNDIKRILRKAGNLTRDARRVERKKVGLKKARKGSQYSKR